MNNDVTDLNKQKTITVIIKIFFSYRGSDLARRDFDPEICSCNIIVKTMCKKSNMRKIKIYV